MKTATEDFTVKSGKVYRPILDTDGSIWKRAGAQRCSPFRSVTASLMVLSAMSRQQADTKKALGSGSPQGLVVCSHRRIPGRIETGEPRT